MGDEQIGEVELLLQLLKEIDDLSLNGDVQGGDGLVTDDERGVDGQGPGDAYALTLTPAELMGVPVYHIRVQAHQLEELLHPVLALGLGPDLVDNQGLFDYGPYSHTRV